jgi:hypothetical protein
MINTSLKINSNLPDCPMRIHPKFLSPLLQHTLSSIAMNQNVNAQTEVAESFTITLCLSGVDI